MKLSKKKQRFGRNKISTVRDLNHGPEGYNTMFTFCNNLFAGY
jgi:hypothetical protein